MAGNPNREQTDTAAPLQQVISLQEWTGRLIYCSPELTNVIRPIRPVSHMSGG